MVEVLREVGKRKRTFFHTKKLLFIGIAIFLACLVGVRKLTFPRSTDERNQENLEYAKNQLGPIIFDYQKKNGSLPTSFDKALEDYRGRLFHRGDAFGCTLLYLKASETSFVFLCLGRNRKYDEGEIDDLIIVYENSEWRIGNKRDAELAFSWPSANLKNDARQ